MLPYSQKQVQLCLVPLAAKIANTRLRFWKSLLFRPPIRSAGLAASSSGANSAAFLISAWRCSFLYSSSGHSGRRTMGFTPSSGVS